jgi:NADPH:quinone reductase-like Zn-dependent oxidoreductase
MKAAIQREYGPPDVVRVTEVAQPVPRHDELLVRVHAATVNRTDCGFRAGSPPVVRLFSGLLRPRQKTLGNEYAGVVESVGDAVTGFTVGDRVFGYNEGPFGCHAEYLTVPETASVATMPPGMTFAEAAPGTEGSHYALSFIRKAGITEDQRVLVNGATGAIGSAAVQLLRGMGAHVTAVCGTAHLELVAKLGAERVIDYTAEDFTEDDQEYDVVLDSVGKSTFGRCRPILADHGAYLSSELGPWSQNPLLAVTTPLLGGKRVMFPIPKHDQAMVNHLRDLMAEGTFTPLVDRTYPLDDVVEAYRYVESGQKIGNVVLAVTPDAA